MGTIDNMDGTEKILVNRIKCNRCGDVIESETVHDFKWCSCKACAVDGGHEYLRRTGNREDWTEMSEIEDAEIRPEE